MKKINKTAKIASIFMIIVVFLCQDIVYSLNVSHLRVPLGASKRAEETIDVLREDKDTGHTIRILLINPRALRQTEQPEKHPLSLMFLASVLSNASYMQEFSRVYPNYNGKIPNIEIKILDLAAESSDFDLAAYFREMKPDIIGVTSSSRFFNRASDISRIAQKVIPGALRIVGGHHVTVLPRESLEGSGFHAGVIGYGEETLTEIVILKALAKVQNSEIDFSTIEGIVYRTKDGKITVNNPRNNKIPLVEAPPANTMIDLLNLDGYSKDVSFYLEKGKLRGPLASVFTMQGCSFNCSFCANPAKRVRWRTPEDVVSEIGFLFEKGFRLIQIVDGNFSLNMDKAKEFCRLLIAQPWHKEIEWIASTRADLVDKELLQLMRKAGCAGIAFGLETGDEVLFEAMNKGMKIDDVKTAIRLCKEAGLPVKLFIVVGYPGQDWLSIRKTAEFILETRPDSVSVFPVVPWPGSQLYIDGMPRPIFSKKDDWDQWCNRTEQSKRDNRLLAAFRTNEMTPEEIADARDLLKTVHKKMDDPHALREILVSLTKRAMYETFVQENPDITKTPLTQIPNSVFLRVPMDSCL